LLNCNHYNLQSRPKQALRRRGSKSAATQTDSASQPTNWAAEMLLDLVITLTSLLGARFSGRTSLHA
jgi:hypothetical protein